VTVEFRQKRKSGRAGVLAANIASDSTAAASPSSHSDKVPNTGGKHICRARTNTQPHQGENSFSLMVPNLLRRSLLPLRLSTRVSRI